MIHGVKRESSIISNYPLNARDANRTRVYETLIRELKFYDEKKTERLARNAKHYTRLFRESCTRNYIWVKGREAFWTKRIAVVAVLLGVAIS